MPADPNDRYLAAYIAAYGADDLKGRPAEHLDAIREEMMAVEEASDDEVAARFLLAIGYQSINLLDDARRMRSALGIPAPMADADRVQVALSTAEARVEELEGEVARIRDAEPPRGWRESLADAIDLDYPPDESPGWSAMLHRVREVVAALETERAAWIDLREDVLQGGWTGGDAIEINDVLHKIDEYMPDACVEPGVKEPPDAR